jgi:hypothetical protein
MSAPVLSSGPAKEKTNVKMETSLQIERGVKRETKIIPEDITQTGATIKI